MGSTHLPDVRGTPKRHVSRAIPGVIHVKKQLIDFRLSVCVGSGERKALKSGSSNGRGASRS